MKIFFNSFTTIAAIWQLEVATSENHISNNENAKRTPLILSFSINECHALQTYSYEMKWKVQVCIQCVHFKE